MTFGEYLVLSASALVLFCFGAFGLVVQLRGVEPLPGWLRQLVIANPAKVGKRAGSAGTALSALLWVAIMLGLQFLIAAQLVLRWSATGAMLFVAQGVLCVMWLAFLIRTYRTR